MMTAPDPATSHLTLTCQHCGAKNPRPLPYDMAAPDACDQCGAAFHRVGDGDDPAVLVEALEKIAKADFDCFPRQYFMAAQYLAERTLADWNARQPAPDHGMGASEPATPTQAEQIAALEAENARLREVMGWYGEQARLCRLIHSEGDAGRHALSEDGGKRARAALGEARP